MKPGAAIVCRLVFFILAGDLLAADSLPQAPPSTLSRVAECSARDERLFAQNQKDADDWLERYKDFDAAALQKSSPDKYCKWMTEAVIPVKNRILARMEARMADECGFDSIVSNMRDFAASQLIDSKRHMSGPCLGLRDE